MYTLPTDLRFCALLHGLQCGPQTSEAPHGAFGAQEPYTSQQGPLCPLHLPVGGHPDDQRAGVCIGT